MRGFLFKVVTDLFAIQIRVLSWLYQISLQVLGTVGVAFMRFIDPDRLEAYEALMEPNSQEDQSELKKQNLELQLANAATQVRDHAVENDDWTDHHTEALNAIGDALLNEIGWKEESVHRYLKSVVETIDGLEYGTDDL